MFVRHLPSYGNSLPRKFLAAAFFLFLVSAQSIFADELAIQCPGTAPFVKVGDTSRQQVTATGGNGSPLSFFLSTSNLENAVVSSSTGLVTYVGAWYDYGLTCDNVGVTDGTDTSFCSVCWMVGGGSTFKAVIEDVHNVLLGSTVDVRLFLTRADPNRGLGGFDLLLSLDPSALTFLSADPGSVYDSCGWEYFSYRLEEPCAGCPSGLVRLYGFAETNPLPPDPTCGWPGFSAHLPITLATMKVRVAINLDYDCAFIPVRFYWTGCADNAIWTHDRGYTTLGSRIYDYGNPLGIEDPQAGFPGYVGPMFECDYFSDTAVITRDLELRNGGLEILCVDPIGQRGDLNANGFPNEIADAVLFTEYFINGLAVFSPHIEASIAASDINDDGLTLSLPDLIYLIRVILGDTPPIPKPAPTQTALIESREGTISVTGVDQLGAVLLVLRGQSRIEPVRSDLQIISHFDGELTRVLLTVPFDQPYLGAGISGALLRVGDVDVVGAELVTLSGQLVSASIDIPRTFVLEQNYPNPFNPSTTISFDLPSGSDYTLTLYNAAGQKVLERIGRAETPGHQHIDLDMTGYASGIYLYRLDAGGFSATRKALLLK
jgi:hypothetical protein